MDGLWEQVRRGEPGDPQKKGPQTRRVRSGEKLRLYCLEPRPTWYVTHFLGQRTRPCLGDACLCRKLEQPIRTRWTGWILAAESFRPLVVRLLNLTENCWDTCADLRDRTFDATGRVIELWRGPGGSKARVYCRFDPHARALVDVPRLPYTQKDQLLKLWFSEKDGYDEFNQYAHQDWVEPDVVTGARTEPRKGKKGARHAE